MNVLTSRCSGKYVQGLAPDTSGIYKISSGASVESTNFSWTVSGETSYQTDIGYKWTGVNSSYVELVVADYSATESDFSYVSNEGENFYPHSGTQDDIEYQFLGKIFDVAVKAEPYGIKTVNITSASWTDGSYTIAMPHSRYLLWKGYETEYGAILLVDNGVAYGIYTYASSTYDYTYYTIGRSTVREMSFAADSLTITGSGSLTLAYLPL